MYQMDIKEKITCISCGYKFYTIITDNGKTYSWGLNKFNQLGTSKIKTTYKFLKEICEVELSSKTIGNLFFLKTHSCTYKDVRIYR